MLSFLWRKKSSIHLSIHYITRFVRETDTFSLGFPWTAAEDIPYLMVMRLYFAEFMGLNATDSRKEPSFLYAINSAFAAIKCIFN